jgi:hypothetical protein
LDRAAEFSAEIEMKRLDLDARREDNRRDEELRRLALFDRIIQVQERFVSVCERGFIIRQSD